MVISIAQEKKHEIIEAIKTNEHKTSGEIYCVIARKSDDYRWILMIWAAVIALMIPWIFAVLQIDLGKYFFTTLGGWNYGEDKINSQNLYIDLTIQALIFVIAALMTRNNAIVLALTPNFIKRQGVHKFALDQFLAHGMHMTDEKTGVLIYVSLAEHIVEIVADTGIHQKVDKSVWGNAIAKILTKTKTGDLAGGLVDGINNIGEILAQHFPPTPENPNEISDSVVFI